MEKKLPKLKARPGLSDFVTFGERRRVWAITCPECPAWMSSRWRAAGNAFTSQTNYDIRVHLAFHHNQR